MTENIGLEIVNDGGVAVVSFLAASISDFEGICSVSTQIKAYIAKNKPRCVVFDFARVKFFSSRVLGLLLDIRSRLADAGGDVVISTIEPKLHGLFTITNLDKVFRFFPDRASAVKTIRAN